METHINTIINTNNTTKSSQETNSFISVKINSKSRKTISQSKSQCSVKEQNKIELKPLNTQKIKKRLGYKTTISKPIVTSNKKITKKEKTPKEITNFFDSEFAKRDGSPSNLDNKTIPYDYKGRKSTNINPFKESATELNTILKDIKTSADINYAIEKIKQNFCVFDVICLAAEGYEAIKNYLPFYYVESSELNTPKKLAENFESKDLCDRFKAVLKSIKSL